MMDYVNLYMKSPVAATLIAILLLHLQPFVARDAFAKEVAVANSSRVAIDAVSDNGSWISYRRIVDADLSSSTIEIRSTTTDRGYVLEREWANGGAFVGDSKFFVYVKYGGGAVLVDLEGGTTREFDGPSTFSISPDKNIILIRTPERAADRSGEVVRLRVLDLLGNKECELSNVTDYAMDPGGSSVAFITKREDWFDLNVLKISSMQDIRRGIVSSRGDLHSITWGNDTNSMAYLERVKAENESDTQLVVNLVEFPDSDKVSVRSLDLSRHEGLDQVGGKVSRVILNSTAKTIVFSAASGRDTVATTDELDGASLRILHSGQSPRSHAENTSRRALHASILSAQATYAWTPEADRFTKLTKQGESFVSVLGDGRYALVVGRDDFGSSYPFGEISNRIYLVDILNGSRKLVFGGRSISNDDRIPFVSVSPEGNRLLYYAKRSWWLYDVASESMMNLTSGIPFPIDGVEQSSTSPLEYMPYSSPAWIKDGVGVVISDQYDVWLISFDGTAPRRLTDGRASETSYRVIENKRITPIPGCSKCWSISRPEAVGTTGSVFLRMFNERSKHSGIASWGPDRAVGILNYDGQYIADTSIAARADAIVFTAERYDSAPRIIMARTVGRNPSVIAESRMKENEVDRRAQLISYKTDDGREAQGILYFPRGYDAHKTYPMIVSVYERQSNNFYKFLENRYPASDGFDIVTFLDAGYFVLLPDVGYSKNRVGFSACGYITAAVREVTRRSDVSAGHVGIIGHSFGGYEVLFTLGQTDMFAAAVSGAGAFNLVGKYLSNHRLIGGPQYFQFERQQYRFSESLFEDYDAYVANSPVSHASRISTPLLSWFGDSDKQQDVSEGIQLYNAMLRMQKKHVFLVYEGEGHTLSNEYNKLDLNIKIKSWFDYYLQGSEPKGWMIEAR